MQDLGRCVVSEPPLFLNEGEPLDLPPERFQRLTVNSITTICLSHTAMEPRSKIAESSNTERKSDAQGLSADLHLPP